MASLAQLLSSVPCLVPFARTEPDSRVRVVLWWSPLLHMYIYISQLRRLRLRLRHRCGAVGYNALLFTIHCLLLTVHYSLPIPIDDNKFQRKTKRVGEQSVRTVCPSSCAAAATGTDARQQKPKPRPCLFRCAMFYSSRMHNAQ